MVLKPLKSNTKHTSYMKKTKAYSSVKKNIASICTN